MPLDFEKIYSYVQQSTLEEIFMNLLLVMMQCIIRYTGIHVSLKVIYNFSDI